MEHHCSLAIGFKYQKLAASSKQNREKGNDRMLYLSVA
jgi:hypothetical protein